MERENIKMKPLWIAVFVFLSSSFSPFPPFNMRSIFATTLAALAYAASIVSADIISQDGQYNITSPSDHGIFVAGQILPVTYRLGEASPGKVT